MITLWLFMFWGLGMSLFQAFATVFGTFALIAGVFVVIEFVTKRRAKKKGE